MASRQSHMVMESLLAEVDKEPDSREKVMIQHGLVLTNEILENLDRITKSLECIAHVMLTQHNERTTHQER